MKRYLASLLIGLWTTWGCLLYGQPVAESYRELNDARGAGWEVTLVVVGKLEAGAQKMSPGIRAWLKDFRKASRGIDVKIAADKWPAMDIDALVSRNPNFWQAYYEIAPGDPGLMLLHAGLLLSAGEATRSSQLIVVAGQRPGIPKALQERFETLLAHTQKVAEKPGVLIEQGIKLHDKGDHAAAIKKYKEALSLWPQSGFAHYEFGLSLRCQELIAAGEKPPATDDVIVNGGPKNSKEVTAAFARARQHDPLQFRAYQGDDEALIRGLLALVKSGVPAWEKLVKNRQKQVDDEILQQLAAAFQEANIHELALAVRQILAARRGRYVPDDHPFIAASIRKLAPGAQTEMVLKRLAGEDLQVRQLVVPDPVAESKVVQLNQLRLYVPNAELVKRIGADVNPLVNYIKAIEKATAKSLEGEELPKAKGLLIAVGIKPGKKVRVWCQNVEGEIPAQVLQKLEKELAKVETITVTNGAMAFGMEVKVRGSEVGMFPEFPAVWMEAARKSEKTRLVPPDDLFKLIWPD
jgi:hypothetical protein